MNNRTTKMLDDDPGTFGDQPIGPDHTVRPVKRVHAEVVRRFFEHYCACAAAACEGVENCGDVQLSSINPDTGALRVIGRYGVGVAEFFREDAVSASSRRESVFVETRTVSHLGAGRGKEADTVCVFAFVIDSDADTGKAAAPLQLQATITVETSPGNCQYWFFLDHAISANEAKTLGASIRAVSGADSATGVLTQPYRVPGIPNYPTPSKRRRGRTEAHPTSIVSFGPTYSVETLRRAFPAPAEPIFDQQPFAGPCRDPHLLIASLPEHVRSDLTREFDGDRSVEIMRLVSVLKGYGLSPGEIANLALAVAPANSAFAKFIERGSMKLRADVERCYHRSNVIPNCLNDVPLLLKPTLDKFRATLGGSKDLSAFNHSALSQEVAPPAGVLTQAAPVSDPPPFDPKAHRAENLHSVEISTAAHLQNEQFADIKWVVPNYIPEGCTLLAGAPKSGKSWLMLDIAAAVATGYSCLGGAVCEQGDALYLALEDNKRRLNSRLRKLLGCGGKWSARLHYATEWPRADQGAIEAIRKWIESVETPRLVVVDVLAVLKPSRGKRDAYESDFEAVRAFQQLASEKGIAIVIVTHTRKAEAGVDPFDKVSGTLGLSGAADTTLVLARDAKGTTLYGRGRDIPEFEKAVDFNKETCRWTVLGNPAEVQRTEGRRAILAVLSGAPEPMTPKEVSDALGVPPGNVRQLLFKMAKDGEVKKVGTGRYSVADPSDLLDPVTPITE